MAGNPRSFNPATFFSVSEREVRLREEARQRHSVPTGPCPKPMKADPHPQWKLVFMLSLWWQAKVSWRECVKETRGSKRFLTEPRAGLTSHHKPFRAVQLPRKEKSKMSPLPVQSLDPFSNYTKEPQPWTVSQETHLTFIDFDQNSFPQLGTGEGKA